MYSKCGDDEDCGGDGKGFKLKTNRTSEIELYWNICPIEFQKVQESDTRMLKSIPWLET